MTDDMTTFGEARRTGFYAGEFEHAQRTGAAMYAVAFRRTHTSTVEIFKMEAPADADKVMAMLLREGVALEDMWPITLRVGKVESVVVKVAFANDAPHVCDEGHVGCPRNHHGARTGQP